MSNLAFLTKVLCILAFNHPQAAGTSDKDVKITPVSFNPDDNHLKMKVSANFSYKVCWSPM